MRDGCCAGGVLRHPFPSHAIPCMQIYWEIKKYEAQRTANKSTYWVIFELEWRDFYR